MKKEYTKKKLIELGILYYDKYGKQPKAKNWNTKTAGCSRDRIYEQYGSWAVYIDELKKHIPDIKSRKIPTTQNLPSDDLLKILKDFSIKNNKSPTKNDFRLDKTLPHPSLFEKRFGSWNNALEAAGLSINNRHNYYNKTILIDIILDYIAATGELPTIRNFKYSSSCIRHFGSLNAAIQAAGFEPNIQNGFGVDTYGLDGHLYRSQAEAYFADNFLYGRYEYIVEPKYPKPYNRYYDWYIPELDLYIELDGGLRPETTLEKIKLNEQLGKNVVFYNTDEIYNMKTLNIGNEEAGSSATFGA